MRRNYARIYFEQTTTKQSKHTSYDGNKALQKQSIALASPGNRGLGDQRRIHRLRIRRASVRRGATFEPHSDHNAWQGEEQKRYRDVTNDVAGAGGARLGAFNGGQRPTHAQSVSYTSTGTERQNINRHSKLS